MLITARHTMNAVGLSALSLAVYANLAILKLQAGSTTTPGTATTRASSTAYSKDTSELRASLSKLSSSALSLVDTQALVQKGLYSLSSLLDALNTAVATSSQDSVASYSSLKNTVESLKSTAPTLADMTRAVKAEVSAQVSVSTSAQITPVSTALKTLTSTVSALQAVVAQQSGVSYTTLSESVPSTASAAEMKRIQDSITSIAVQLSNLSTVKDDISLLRADADRVNTAFADLLIGLKSSVTKLEGTVSVVQDSVTILQKRADDAGTDLKTLFIAASALSATASGLAAADSVTSARIASVEQGMTGVARDLTSEVKARTDLRDYVVNVQQPQLQNVDAGVSSLAKDSAAFRALATPDYKIPKLTVNGGLEVQQDLAVRTAVNAAKVNVSGGVVFGGDSKHGMYYAGTAANSSLGNGTPTGGDGFASAVRIRTGASSSDGIIFENSAEGRLLSVRGDTGDTVVAGNFSSAKSGSLAGDLSVGKALTAASASFSGPVSVASLNSRGTVCVNYKDFRLADVSDTNWGIYIAAPEAGKAMNAGDPKPYGEVNWWAHRSRAWREGGFLWENSDNTPLMSLHCGSGNLRVRGSIMSDAGQASVEPITVDTDLTGAGSLTRYAGSAFVARGTKTCIITHGSFFFTGGSGLDVVSIRPALWTQANSTQQSYTSASARIARLEGNGVGASSAFSAVGNFNTVPGTRYNVEFNIEGSGDTWQAHIGSHMIYHSNAPVNGG